MIIDCGAYVGDLCIPLAKHLLSKGRGDIRFVAIEPDPHKTTFMQQKAKQEGVSDMIRVVPVGLWNKKCRGDMVKKDEDSSESSWEVRETKKGSIYLDKLDSVLLPNERVALFHLDVEGSEPEALEGAKEMIMRDKPVLIMEVIYPRSREKSIPFLQEIGYQKVMDLPPYDALFVHPDSPKLLSNQTGG